MIQRKIFEIRGLSTSAPPNIIKKEGRSMNTPITSEDKQHDVEVSNLVPFKAWMFSITNSYSQTMEMGKEKLVLDIFGA